MEIILYILGALVAISLLFVVVVAVASLTVDKNKPIEKLSPFFMAVARIILDSLMTIMGVVPHFAGLEKMPQGKFLMVCNHRSMFDPLSMMSRLQKYRIGFVSKPENIALPFVGRIAHAVGCLPIDRENNREALKTILQAANYIKSGVCNMMIYPEGTRSKTGELLPFHAGSFKIAQRAGCDLVIAAVSGSEKVKKRPFKKTHMEVAVLETIPAEKVKAMGTDELAAYTVERISAWLKEKESAA